MEVLPRDPAAERASLAGLYKYGGDAFIEVDGILTEDTYTDPFHRAFWRCLQHVFESRGADAKFDLAVIDSAAGALGLRHHFESADDVKLLRGMTLFHVEQENVAALAKQIRKLSVVRGMRERLLGAAQSYEKFTGMESLDDIVTKAESAVFDYEKELAGETDDAVEYGEMAPEYVENVIANPVTSVGFPTGFPEFDRAIGHGVRPGGINLIATRMKTGKSWVADKMAIHFARTGVAPIIVDTEMERNQRSPRALASLSKLYLDDIERGSLRTEEERRRLRAAATDFKALRIGYKGVSGRPFSEIISMLRRWVVKRVKLDPQTRQANPSVVLFDWFQLPDGDGLKRMDEHQAIGFQMKKLKAFLNRYNVACVAFVQMNRTGITDETTAVVAQSDRLAQFCDSLSLLKWKDSDDLALEYSKPKDQPRYTHKLIAGVAGTARYGPGMAPEDYIHVSTDYARGQIDEGPLNSKLDSDDPSAEPTEDASQEGGGGQYTF